MIPQKYRRKIGKIVNDCFNDESGKIVKGVIVDVVERHNVTINGVPVMFKTMSVGISTIMPGYVYKIMPLQPATAQYIHVAEFNFGMKIDNYIIGGPTKADKVLAKKARTAYKMLKVLDK